MKLNNKICFIISIIGLLFVFVTVYQYKNKILEEEYVISYNSISSYIENLENPPDTEKDLSNISSEPTETTYNPTLSSTYNAENVTGFVAQTIANVIKTLQPTPQGPPGQIGPKGSQGDTGGTFSNKGRLRAASNLNLFLDRNTNKLLLKPKSIFYPQIWIHNSDKKLVNQYDNQCLNATDNGELEISNCLSAEKWEYKNGQLQTTKPINGSNKCLTFKNSPEKGSSEQNSVVLENCSRQQYRVDDKNTPALIVDQYWSFY
jgi:hypothetical protein